VPLDLADDVRRRVGRQLDAPVEVEAVDRLDQADGADLDEILELLAAVRVGRASERTSDMYCSISCSRAWRSPSSW